MLKRAVCFLVFLLCILSVSAFADDAVSHSSTKKSEKTTQKDKNSQKEKDKKVKSHWKGTSVQLGAVINTGNTESVTSSVGLNAQYTNDPWSNNFQGNYWYESSDGDTTKNKYSFLNQANYNFSEHRKNYIFGRAYYLHDAFSAYEYQVVTAVGYGRDLIKTDRFSWSVQAGPGLRHDKVDSGETSSNNLIGTTASKLQWKITKNTIFSEQISYDFGNPYDYLNSVTALTNKIVGNLAVQVSFTVEYYSEIPLGSSNTKNTDTTTNIALVYNFA